LFSNASSTLQRPAGLRLAEPLKMTSCIDSPRSSAALLSPSTQRTASITLDLPQPFGPRHLDLGGVDERLEAGQLDLPKAHG